MTQGLVMPTAIDLGTVEAGKECEVPITLANATNERIRINQVDLSCGCIQLTHQQDGTSEKYDGGEIEAGKSHIVTLMLKPESMQREFDQMVIFHVANPDMGPFRVRVHGHVRPGVYANPTELQWGLVRPGDRVTRSIQLIDERPESERDTLRLYSTSPHIRVGAVTPMSPDAVPANTPAGATVFDVNLWLPSTHQIGLMQSSIIVENSAERRLTEIPVYLEFRPPVRLIPTVVVLPRPGAELPYVCRIQCEPSTVRHCRLSPATPDFVADYQDRILTLKYNGKTPPTGKRTLEFLTESSEGEHTLSLEVFFLPPPTND